MGVLEIPVRMLSEAHKIRLEDDILAGDRERLLDHRLDVNPENPQEGRLWTQWRSLDDARAFADRLREPSRKNQVQPAGEPTLLADPHYLARDPAPPAPGARQAPRRVRRLRSWLYKRRK